MGRSTRRRKHRKAGRAQISPSMIPRGPICRVSPRHPCFRLTSSKLLMFFLVFSMLLVGIAASASDAAARDTGVNRLVQVAVDPNLIVTVTVPWMPLLPAKMEADSRIPELQTVRANQLGIGYASNVVLPLRKEATKKPLQTAKRHVAAAWCNRNSIVPQRI